MRHRPEEKMSRLNTPTTPLEPYFDHDEKYISDCCQAARIATMTER